MKPILLISKGQDPHVLAVIRRLSKKAYPYVYFDTLKVRAENSLYVSDGLYNHEVYVRNDKKKYRIEDFKSVWFRKPFLHLKYPSNWSPKSILANLLKENELKEVVKALLLNNSADVFYVNYVVDVNGANNKIVQIARSNSVGLKTPKSLISTDKQEIISFLESNSNIGIIKALGKPYVEYGRRLSGFYAYSISTNEFKKYYLRRKIDYPIYIQEKINIAYELRVTVIGNSIFPIAIYRQQYDPELIDIRRIQNEKLSYKIEVLPDEISSKIFNLLKMFKLQFSSIDMAVTLTGDYVFFDLNPNGQYLWLEEITGVPLSQAMANLLSDPEHYMLK